jgi:hypothetical protein
MVRQARRRPTSEAFSQVWLPGGSPCDGHPVAHPPVGALVADRVDTIVRRGSGPFEPLVMITEDAVTPTVRLLRADTVSEPLLTLPEAVAWAYDYEFQHPGKKMTDMLADRVRVLGGG